MVDLFGSKIGFLESQDEGGATVCAAVEELGQFKVQECNRTVVHSGPPACEELSPKLSSPACDNFAFSLG